MIGIAEAFVLAVTAVCLAVTAGRWISLRHERKMKELEHKQKLDKEMIEKGGER